MALFDKFTKKNNTSLVPSSVLPTILEALAQEGYRPERDKDVRIVYKNEGIYCCFYYREDDPEFLMVRATFERAAFDDVHESYLYRACSMTDFDQKVSKAYIDEDGDVVFSVEAFMMLWPRPSPSSIVHSSNSPRSKARASEVLTLMPPSSLPRVAYLANRLSLEEYSPIVALPSSSLVLRYRSWRRESVCFCLPWTSGS